MNTLGYREWTDAFNFQNIPKPLQNTAYHLELGEATLEKVDQDNQTVVQPLRVRILFAGQSDPNAKRATVDVAGKAVVTSFQLPENRLTQAVVNSEKILNVIFQSKTIDVIDVTNDNSMFLVLNFDFKLIRSLRGE